MTNYEDDNIDDDEVEGNEPTDEEEGGAAPSNNNRNFLLALGGMGLIFLLLVIAFLVYWFSTRPSGNPTANVQGTQIAMTNVVIATSNEQTAAAATQAGIALSQTAAFLLTPSITPTASNTPVQPTITKTPLIAQGTASNTPATAQGGGVPTSTLNLQTRTATIAAALTQNAQQTQTQVVKARLTGTATALPKTGFAEDVGLPGLFGLAIGLVLVIVLVRRLRLSTNG